MENNSCLFLVLLLLLNIMENIPKFKPNPKSRLMDQVRQVLNQMKVTHLLEDGVNIRLVQELMGHDDVKTTEIYTHVMEKDIKAAGNPIAIWFIYRVEWWG